MILHLYTLWDDHPERALRWSETQDSVLPPVLAVSAVNPGPRSYSRCQLILRTVGTWPKLSIGMLTGPLPSFIEAHRDTISSGIQVICFRDLETENTQFCPSSSVWVSHHSCWLFSLQGKALVSQMNFVWNLILCEWNFDLWIQWDFLPVSTTVWSRNCFTGWSEKWKFRVNILVMILGRKLGSLWGKRLPLIFV